MTPELWSAAWFSALLSIVLIGVPLLYVMRNTTFYRTGIRVAGSGAVMFVAVFWLAERMGLWQS